MAVNLEEAKKLIDSAAEDLQKFPATLPSECGRMLAETILTPAKRNEIAALPHQQLGMLAPPASSLKGVQDAFDAVRERIHPSRNKAYATALKRAPVWIEISQLTTMLQDCQPRLAHPLSVPLESLVTETAKWALACALDPGLTADTFRTFALAARNIEREQITPELTHQMLKTARGVLRPEYLDQLEHGADAREVGSLIDFLQQKANHLAGETEDQAGRALQKLRQNADDIRQKAGAISSTDWLKTMQRVGLTFEQIGTLQAQKQYRDTLTEHQHKLGAYADGIGLQLAKARPSVKRAFEEAGQQIKAATGLADQALRDGQKMFAQARQASAFLDTFAKGRTSTEDLVGMLELPAVQNLPELDALKQPLKVLQALQEDAATDLKKALDGGGGTALAAAAALAGNLGVEPAVVQTAQAIIGVAGAVASGNVFAAIGLLAGSSNVFAGMSGGSDPAVKAQLQAIEGKLDEVIKNQKLMMDKLDEIDGKLNALRGLVERDHTETMNALSLIQQELLRVLSLLDEAATDKLRHCSVFVGGEQTDKDDQRLGFLGRLTYGERKQYFDTYHQYFSECIDDGLGFLFRDPDEPSAQFFIGELVGRNPQDPQAVHDYISFADATFEPYRAQLPETPLDRAQNLARILHPALTVEELAEKYAQDQHLPANDPLADATNKVSQFLNGNSLLLVERVCAAAERAMVAAKIYPFVDDDQKKLLSPDAIDTLSFERSWAGGRQERACGWLTDSMKLLNIAIAQQTLLAGDWHLPHYTANFNDDPSKGISKVIAQQPRLTRNFVMFLVRQRLTGTKDKDKEDTKLAQPFLQYALACRLDDSYYLQKLLRVSGKPDLTIKKGPRDAWCLVDTTRPDPLDLSLILPSPKDLEAGILELPEDLTRLVKARERVANLLAEIRLGDSLSAENRRTLARVAVYASLASS